MAKKVLLKVVEALPSDVGHGKIRIDADTRSKLGVSPGDIVEVTGSKTTAAVVWRLRPEDEGKKTMRIDGMVRKNAGSYCRRAATASSSATG
jgi:transitional endoplasmic reticulum ATPase